MLNPELYPCVAESQCLGPTDPRSAIDWSVRKKIFDKMDELHYLIPNEPPWGQLIAVDLYTAMQLIFPYDSLWDK
jgi:hypothetical protein